jgi:hypothetical protein
MAHGGQEGLFLVLTKLYASGGGPKRALPFPARKGRAVSQVTIAQGAKTLLK